MTSNKQGVIEDRSVVAHPLEGEPESPGSPSNNSPSFLLPLSVGGYDHE